MSQLLDLLPKRFTHRILCSYLNDSGQIQIVRIENIPHWYFERVVFPGERLVFETVSEAVLEIHSGSAVGAILEDRIPCTQLHPRQRGDRLEWT
uniref:DUF1830 domain-containing protein n=1 Tax=Cyanothece sp. (strain PCC 7425 / ATCC 29141) TaxID=395961 RepID=B8HKU4_CYAP4